ncbi:MAG TPA: hypothetical protein VK168_10590 [Saprospiraceae bacterium]|nr:hypothetical protein [Saprospiraceae bacterium]
MQPRNLIMPQNRLLITVLILYIQCGCNLRVHEIPVETTRYVYGIHTTSLDTFDIYVDIPVRFKEDLHAIQWGYIKNIKYVDSTNCELTLTILDADLKKDTIWTGKSREMSLMGTLTYGLSLPYSTKSKQIKNLNWEGVFVSVNVENSSVSLFEGFHKPSKVPIAIKLESCQSFAEKEAYGILESIVFERR